MQEHVSGRTQMLLLENSYHMITIDRERRMLSKASAKFFSEIPASATALTPAA